MSHYLDSSDLQNAASLIALAPAEANAFLQFKNISERKDGKIPARYRELISLAVALSTQCAYCIDVHSKAARREGVSAEEIAETVFITAALRAGAAVGYGLLAQRLFAEAD
jgi:AhpD family alkylhydroperoxidase